MKVGDILGVSVKKK